MNNLSLTTESMRANKLSGDESIAQIIQKFQVGREIVTSASKEGLTYVESKRAICRQKLEALMHEVYYPSEMSAVEQAINYVPEAFICAELDAKYDQVSPRLFNLKRKLEIEVTCAHYRSTKDTAQCVMPVFVSARLGSVGWEYRETVPVECKANSATQHTVDIVLNSQMPPLDSDAKKKAREMIADVSMAYAHAFQTPGIGDVLLKRDCASRESPLELKVFWIPKDEDLYIETKMRPDPDPILIGSIHGVDYLVHQWNVKGEEPFEHYLGEFKL